jgi:Ca2+-binding RTX toxin-like protein
MATTTFGWISLSAESVLSTGTEGFQGPVALEANAAGTGYFATWSAGYQPMGRLIGSDGTPVTSEFLLDPLASVPLFGAKMARLPDGRFVSTYTAASLDAPGEADVRGRVISADGSSAGSLDVAVGSFVEVLSDVTALTDGGFAFSWQRVLGGQNADIYISVYNADGTVRHAPVAANVDPDHSNNSSIAALAGGGFVVAWESEPAGGFDEEVRFRRFDAAGNPLDAAATGVLIDAVGFNNENIRIAGLPDGGFVVAYEDDEWGTATDITARVYNADGTPRSGFFQANSVLNGASTFGDQEWPSLTVAPEGYFVVGWRSDNVQLIQAFTAFGNPIGQSIPVAGNVLQGEITALAGGVLASAWATVPGPNDSSNAIHTTTLALRRFITGDGSNETINGLDHTIGDVVLGLGGKDIIDAGAGNDTINGGAGDDTIIGGAGDDTAVFSHSAVNYVALDFGSKIGVWGAEGIDTLSGIEHLQFADGTMPVTGDGNALFDTLFYLSRNPDVFHAGVNALDHFNAIGWQEDRNPNAFFDTSGYLAVNKDVAAAGINPLDHYHNSGWHDGRDPSVAFDTTLYLINNPDVAVAGVDPLAHYLQFGYAEGRKSYAAIGQDITGGFDAQHYLFFNPDVAAAGIDPLFHFNAVGWQEGRDPNAWFDTAGYLAHYTDVAAAGINPLQHYAIIGWKEGRDPSAGFDTLGYLAANPDVAAANYNPLDHFLQHGIYEGRQTVNDGIWH